LVHFSQWLVKTSTIKIGRRIKKQNDLGEHGQDKHAEAYGYEHACHDFGGASHWKKLKKIRMMKNIMKRTRKKWNTKRKISSAIRWIALLEKSPEDRCDGESKRHDEKSQEAGEQEEEDIISH
jgi:hypothetical protein